MAARTSTLKEIGDAIYSIVKDIGYIHAKKTGDTGVPGKDGTREFRIVPGDVNNKKRKEEVWKLFSSKNLSDLKFNERSPNSGKFSSISFTEQDVKVDLVIAGGANAGERFEQEFLKKMSGYVTGTTEESYDDLFNLLERANPEFQRSEIISVRARTGSTVKEGVPYEKLGEVIGDVVIETESGTLWYVSVKDVNGDTVSSYSGAASLFNSKGDLQSRSRGAQFLAAFDVDLDRVQKGFDERAGRVVVREKIGKVNTTEDISKIFKRVWGMNYFYVRKLRSSWKVFWIDREMFSRLTSNIRITQIKGAPGIDYPSVQRKQITIFCENSAAKYKIEIRNSKKGEYPNDIKFKILSLNL